MCRADTDVGSTTIKVVTFNDNYQLLFSRYKRHFSDAETATIKVLKEAISEIGDQTVSIAITGSGEMGLADVAKIPFIQETIATTTTIEKFIPQTGVVIELGGEDTEMTFFGDALEQHMNGTCAGSTGIFIDQTAELLKANANGVNELAKGYEVVYLIASRYGVFAKTDVQPLINKGARKEGITASIFQAVVSQTIADLASGRRISGNITFLGGLLFLMSGFHQCFIETLNIKPENIIFPENPQLLVTMGAALDEDQMQLALSEIIHNLENNASESLVPKNTLDVLFRDQAELDAWCTRHNEASVEYKDIVKASGPVFLGIDAGSTTLKVVLTDPEGAILFQYYGNDQEQPLENVIEVLREIYRQLPGTASTTRSCVADYDEDLIKAALHVDYGEAKIVAHFKVTSYFSPGVDFILDIDGQDMKAMNIQDDALSSIQLNGTCSSGCGSLTGTLAESLKYDVKDFTQVVLLAKRPIDLGSKYTVFANSKVKQVQEEGATVVDIFARLSYSVIKNALYKAVKPKRPEDLGEKIVVQDSTFYNEVMPRAFELVSEREVVRPSTAGLVGAYGYVIIAQEKYEDETVQAPTVETATV